MKINGLDDLLKIKARGLRSLYPQKRKVTVGMASCGLASGAGEVYGALQDYIKEGRELYIQLLNVFPELVHSINEYTGRKCTLILTPVYHAILASSLMLTAIYDVLKTKELKVYGCK